MQKWNWTQHSQDVISQINRHTRFQTLLSQFYKIESFHELNLTFSSDINVTDSQRLSKVGCEMNITALYIRWNQN